MATTIFFKFACVHKSTSEDGIKTTGINRGSKFSIGSSVERNSSSSENSLCGIWNFTIQTAHNELRIDKSLEENNSLR